MGIEKNSYNEFIKSVEIKAINLTHLTCGKSPNAKNNTLNPEKDLRYEVEVGMNFEIKEQKPNFLVALASILVEVKNPAKNTKLKPKKEKVDLEKREETKEAEFTISFKYEILYYHNNITIDDEIIKTFVNVNVPINIWPYARELVSSITTRMGYSPLILGAYKIVR